MKMFYFAMLLAWPLPGGGRIPSIAYAKLMHLPSLQVLGSALATFMFTVGVMMLLSRLLRHKKATKLRQVLVTKRANTKIGRCRASKLILSRLRKAETNYVNGQRSTKLLLAQLPWCPGGLFSSIGLIHKWKLPRLSSLLIVLASGWASFVVYYYAASVSIYVAAALIVVPIVARRIRKHSGSFKLLVS